MWMWPWQRVGLMKTTSTGFVFSLSSDYKVTEVNCFSILSLLYFTPVALSIVLFGEPLVCTCMTCENR